MSNSKEEEETRQLAKFMLFVISMWILGEWYFVEKEHHIMQIYLLNRVSMSEFKFNFKEDRKDNV